jgi:hypothetical protein
MSIEPRRLLDVLCEAQAHRNSINFPASCGVYAIFGTRDDCLPGIALPDSRLLYVGIATGTLSDRDHFITSNSCGHSPRRSLGAVLKEHLRLRARHRGKGLRDNDFSNYWFDDGGEQRLSQWMLDSLLLSVYPVEDNLHELERQLCELGQPPLELTKWPNAQKKKILALRAACSAEARARFIQDR